MILNILYLNFLICSLKVHDCYRVQLHNIFMLFSDNVDVNTLLKLFWQNLLQNFLILFYVGNCVMFVTIITSKFGHNSFGCNTHFSL